MDAAGVGYSQRVNTNGDGQPMLNEYNGAITFLLQMNVLSGAEGVTSWIQDRSVRATFDFEEENSPL